MSQDIFMRETAICALIYVHSVKQVASLSVQLHVPV